MAPLKASAARRHGIGRARHRVTNWPASEAGLRQRNDVMRWLDQAALAGWVAPRCSQPGSQPRCSGLAVELVPTLRLVFHPALRQAEAFARSVLALLGLKLRVPDHLTLSRLGRAVGGQPRVRASGGLVYLMSGQHGAADVRSRQWRAAKHGRAGRRWLKLHIGVNAVSGEIAAHVLTDGQADDAAQMAAPYYVHQLLYCPDRHRYVAGLPAPICTRHWTALLGRLFLTCPIRP